MVKRDLQDLVTVAVRKAAVNLSLPLLPTRVSSALLTDLYELTILQAYHASGMNACAQSVRGTARNVVQPGACRTVPGDDRAGVAGAGA